MANTPPTISTFSVVATDGRDWGVAVASKFLAVGSAVPAAVAGVGALATQAMANGAYRPRGLELLAAGYSAAQVVAALSGGDAGRDRRQLGVVDGQGGAASWTGPGCMEWAGGRTGQGCACQGNILAGPQVVDALVTTFEATRGELADRLLAALASADGAGGDRRGRQSAALLVVRSGAGYGGFDDRMIDLRVDDHPRPIPELVRLRRLWEHHFGTAEPDSMIPASDEIVERLRQGLSQRGQPSGQGSREEVFAALERWAGVENLEQRCTGPELIDPLLLELLEKGPGAG